MLWPIFGKKKEGKARGRREIKLCRSVFSKRWLPLSPRSQRGAVCFVLPLISRPWQKKIVSVRMLILIWLMETKEEEEDLASKTEGRHTDQNVP